MSHVSRNCIPEWYILFKIWTKPRIPAPQPCPQSYNYETKYSPSIVLIHKNVQKQTLLNRSRSGLVECVLLQLIHSIGEHVRCPLQRDSQDPCCPIPPAEAQVSVGPGKEDGAMWEPGNSRNPVTPH